MHSRSRSHATATLLLAVGLTAGLGHAAEPAPELDVRGMTFVASRADNNALILRAGKARFDTDEKLAYLRDVDAEIPATTEQTGFRMWCDASVVDLSSNDFEATGNVHGQADSGERFTAEWVRYDHSRGVLFTDAPVTIVDQGTTVQGGGFDYDIDSRKFQLRGGAKVIQDPEHERGRVAVRDGGRSVIAPQRLGTLAIGALTSAWLTGVGVHAAAAETGSISVAPFVEASPDSSLDLAPRLESRLAARISALAEGRGRARFDVTRFEAERLEADQVRARAKEEGAEYVLLGRWRREEGGDRTRLGLQLRSGHSGATEHRYALQLNRLDPSADEIEAEVSRVAFAMIDDLGWSAPPASVSTGPEALDASKPGKRKRTDFLRVERDQPIEINSEDLELRAVGDTKHLIFRREVSVVQGEMELQAGYLEAFYPKGASQPNRLDARQAVRVREGDLEVRCNEVTYLRDAERVICRGDALLVQGCDEVRGREIEFHIDEERVEVKGAASVVLHLEEEGAPAQRCTPGGAG